MPRSCRSRIWPPSSTCAWPLRTGNERETSGRSAARLAGAQRNAIDLAALGTTFAGFPYEDVIDSLGVSHLSAIVVARARRDQGAVSGHADAGGEKALAGKNEIEIDRFIDGQTDVHRAGVQRNAALMGYLAAGIKAVDVQIHHGAGVDFGGDVQVFGQGVGISWKTRAARHGDCGQTCDDPAARVSHLAAHERPTSFFTPGIVSSDQGSRGFRRTPIP